MRHSNHSHEVRRYRVGADGLEIGDPVEGYDRVITGLPVPRDS